MYDMGVEIKLFREPEEAKWGWGGVQCDMKADGLQVKPYKLP